MENFEDTNHNVTDSEISEKPRHDGNHSVNSSEIDEFFYHTDVRIDFKRNFWYWNSTNEIVERSSWDNTDYFQSYYPYMQDAVALNMYTDKVLYRIFVSFKMTLLERTFIYYVLKEDTYRLFDFNI